MRGSLCGKDPTEAEAALQARSCQEGGLGAGQGGRPPRYARSRGAAEDHPAASSSHPLIHKAFGLSPCVPPLRTPTRPREGMFEQGSKLTHTCGEPNTAYQYSGGRGVHVAVRDIAPRELLSTSYIGAQELPAWALLSSAARCVLHCMSTARALHEHCMSSHPRNSRPLPATQPRAGVLALASPASQTPDQFPPSLPPPEPYCTHGHARRGAGALVLPTASPAPTPAPLPHPQPPPPSTQASATHGTGAQAAPLALAYTTRRPQAPPPAARHGL